VKISFRIRRERMIAAVVLALALGGFAAAFPARAAVRSGLSPAAVGSAVITDSLSGTVTGPDAIVNCATSQIAIGHTEAVVIPVGCLTEYNGEFYEVSWTGTGVTTELTMQNDANFVLYASNGKKWAAGTRFVDNSNGPGCLAEFQSDANLVVRNCNLAAIWNSGTHTYPNAVLAFQADGNLVIYPSTSSTALWSTKTN
jgi:hypothetical protein